MTIEQALYTKLTTDAGVLAIVAARVYPHFVPQKNTPGETQLPTVVYQNISDPNDYSHDGETALHHPRFQITSFASTYLAAKALALAVKTALSASTGAWGTITIDGVFCDSASDVLDLDPEVESQTLFGIRQDFVIWYEG